MKKPKCLVEIAEKKCKCVNCKTRRKIDKDFEELMQKLLENRKL